MAAEPASPLASDPTTESAAPVTTSSLRAASGVPFRIKMAGISAVAVIVTLTVILIPVYILSRDLLGQVLGEQVTAVTRSTSVAISGDSLDAIAERGGASTNAYRTTRTMLQRMWLANGGSLTDLVNGIAVVRTDSTGKLRYLIHSTWQPGQPQFITPWQPPTGLLDSLRAGRGAVTGIYDANGTKVLTAAAPVRRADGEVAGFVVTTLGASTLFFNVRRQLQSYIGFPLVAFAIAVIFAYWGAARLTGGIIAIADHADAVASGSLRHDLNYSSGDEIGALADSFRRMSTSLRALLLEIETGASEVAATAEQLAAGAQQMTASTDQVAGAAHSIAQSATVQTKGINTAVDASTRVADRAFAVAGHARSAQSAADVVARSAQRGVSAAEQALESMSAIARVTKDAVPAVNELGEKSQRIGKITDAIGAIARQTNLLALNAAIEASRAGEHGKGFAVVADEVRKLAGESARALDTIRKLATEIRNAAIRTEEHIGQVSDRVAEGESVIRASSVALGQISREIEASRSAVDLIVASADAQREEAAALAKEIESIAVVAEQNAATSQEVSAVVQQQTASMTAVASSSQHLAAIAERLKGSMTQFSL
jgi:methyl-accepting chemotaxis protein